MIEHRFDTRSMERSVMHTARRAGRGLRTSGAAAAIALLSLGSLASPARADGPPAADDPVVGYVNGDKVNLRVGPRLDDAPVTQLEQGSAVVIVERSGEWLGVRVPAGFSAAVAARLVEPIDSDHVQITAPGVNLRVRPPTADRAYPAFRDHPALGAILPVVDRDGDWVWVEAPEEIRGYVHAKYVTEVGPLSANLPRVEKAREVRRAREETRAKSRVDARRDADDRALRAEVGAVAQRLLDARAAGGYDTAPIAVLADRLASTIDAHPAAPPRARALADALAQDLDREMQIRVAYADEILARKRTGQPPPDAPAPPAPKDLAVRVTGFLRWEPMPSAAGAVPGAPETGAYVLWSGDANAERPVNVLRWTGGDLKPFLDKVVVVRGKALGGRLLGLPLVEVDAVEPAR
jgi:hypothetical protein